MPAAAKRARAWIKCPLGFLPTPPAPLPPHASRCSAQLRSTHCLFFVGWLVPTYFVLRWRHQAAQRRGAAPRAQRPPEPAGPPASPQHSGSSMGSATGGAVVAMAEHVAPRRHWWRITTNGDALASWVLEDVFLADVPPGFAPLAWWVLAVLSWMAASLLPVLDS